MIIPTSVDVPQDRIPFTNYLLIGFTCLCFLAQFGTEVEAIKPFVLNGWNMKGIIGHLFLHGGILHLVGNMIFLYVFGNAVCSKIGNLTYLPIYLLLGFASAFTHLLFDGDKAIGASGAINGIVGMFLILFPLNDINCIWVPGLMLLGLSRSFTISSMWVIFFWLFFDIVGAYLGGGNVGYMAHLGGFAGGAAIAIILLMTGLLKSTKYEKNLLEYFGILKNPQLASQTVRVAETENIPKEEPSKPNHALEANNLDDLFQSANKGFHDKYSNTANVANTNNSLSNTKNTQEMIRFECSHCGKRIKVKSKYAGHQAKCPTCSNKVTIPNN